MKYFLYSIISGFLFGLINIILKIVLKGDSIYEFFLNPLFLVAGVLGFFVFILSQVALKKIKSSIVTLLMTIAATTVSVVGSGFLGEVINIYEMLGILLMMSSIVIILSKK